MAREKQWRWRYFLFGNIWQIGNKKVSKLRKKQYQLGQHRIASTKNRNAKNSIINYYISFKTLKILRLPLQGL